MKHRHHIAVYMSKKACRERRARSGGATPVRGDAGAAWAGAAAGGAAAGGVAGGAGGAGGAGYILVKGQNKRLSFILPFDQITKIVIFYQNCDLLLKS